MTVKKNTPDFLKHSGLSFTTIINETIHLIPDAGALGIYCYLASKSENWNICQKHLQNRFKKGRDYIHKKMDILKKIGLVKKQSFRDEKGQITHWETTLTNFIPTQNTENPECGESRHLEKQALLNKRELPNKREKQIKECPLENSGLYDFEEFYKAYPRKEQKLAAERAWKKGKLWEIADYIMDHLDKRIIHDYKFRLKKHIPLPATWLNGKMWQDEITPKSEEKIVTKEKNARIMTNDARSTVPEWGPGHPGWEEINGFDTKHREQLLNAEAQGRGAQELLEKTIKQRTAKANNNTVSPSVPKVEEYLSF